MLRITVRLYTYTFSHMHVYPSILVHPGAEAGATSKLGMEYNSGTYTYYKSLDTTWDHAPFSLVTTEHGVIDARVYLIPTISFYLYDLTGVSISAKPYLGIKVSQSFKTRRPLSVTTTSFVIRTAAIYRHCHCID